MKVYLHARSTHRLTRVTVSAIEKARSNKIKLSCAVLQSQDPLIMQCTAMLSIQNDRARQGGDL